MATPGSSNRPLRVLVISLVLLLALVVGTAAGLKLWYDHNLQPVSSSTEVKYFGVDEGASVHQIANNLEDAGLIRSVSAFETYVTTNNYRDKLQAGTYSLNPSMSVQTIVGKMVSGDVARNLLTILPGKRLDQIKATFVKAGYSQAEVDAAFDPARYAGHPALADLPKGASLEGYLYPDSFQKQSDTPASTIVRESLDEMEKYLTKDIKDGFAAHGLTVHQGVTLASIVMQESGDASQQPTIAQVFLSRLKQDKALESNVTAYYASDIAGTVRTITIDSPYNTYLYKGLPPGPISNVTHSALNAVAHPSNTDYLFFVAGDDCKVYFSRTVQEHQAAIDAHLKNGCNQ